jgi:hypothetical protein
MDFSPALVDSCFDGSRMWWTYEFPNGHSAAVSLDPEFPFRFEVESSDPEDVKANPVRTTTGAGTVANLTTEQVEAKLAKLAGLERVEYGQVTL